MEKDIQEMKKVIGMIPDRDTLEEWNKNELVNLITRMEIVLQKTYFQARGLSK